MYQVQLYKNCFNIIIIIKCSIGIGTINPAALLIASAARTLLHGVERERESLHLALRGRSCTAYCRHGCCAGARGRSCRVRLRRAAGTGAGRVRPSFVYGLWSMA